MAQADEWSGSCGVVWCLCVWPECCALLVGGAGHRPSARAFALCLGVSFFSFFLLVRPAPAGRAENFDFTVLFSPLGTRAIINGKAVSHIDIYGTCYA